MYVLVLFLTILNTTLTIHFDYHLERAKKLWVGLEHAIHFPDHLKILNPKMSNLTGVMTTSFKLKTKKEFNLGFTVQIHNEAQTEHDGFLLMLTKNPFKTSDLIYKKNEIFGHQTKFQETTQHIKNSGFYLLFTGGYDKGIYAGYETENLNITKNFLKNCTIQISQKTHFLVKLHDGNITLGIDFKDDQPMKIFQTFYAHDWIEDFYITILARSGWDSKTQYEIHNLVLASDVENLNIARFEDSHVLNEHRLFQQLHFYTNNQDLIKLELDFVHKKHLNISSIASFQNHMLENLKVNNIYLSKTLDISDEIEGFLEQQNSVLMKFTNDVISSIQRLINSSVSSFEEIEKDSKFIINEYSDFNLDDEFQNAKNAIESLKKKVEISVNKLNVFEDFEDVINENLNFLKEKENELEKLPENVAKYLLEIKKHDSKNHERIFLMILISSGIFVVGGLLAVYWRIGIEKRKN